MMVALMNDFRHSMSFFRFTRDHKGYQCERLSNHRLKFSRDKRAGPGQTPQPGWLCHRRIGFSPNRF